MGAAHTKQPLFLDKIKHQFKKGICTCTKGTIRGQNKGDEQSITFPSRRLNPGVAFLSHFDITKEGIDTTPHFHTTALHGRVARKGGYGHINQESITLGILTDQISPPGAKILGGFRIHNSAFQVPSIAESCVQQHILYLTQDFVV